MHTLIGVCVAFMSSKNKKLYEVLGVKSNATDAEIRSKYRKLAREFHPDVNPGDDAAEARFKEIAGAYQVLSDDKARKAYDEFGEDSLRGGFDAEQARSYQQWQKPRPGSRTSGGTGRPFQQQPFVNFEDLFGGGFGGGFGGAQYAQRGEDIHAIAELDLAQVVNGTEVSLNLPGQSKATRVRIPAGADTGSKIRLRGKGGPGVGQGGPGDLVIETRVKPHPRVQRKGLDLTIQLPITLAEAYNGASIEVPTFSGNVRVTIPALSQNGAKLRLRNRGIKRKSKKGDFFVELDIRMPVEHDETLSKALRAAEVLYKGPVREGLRL